MARPRIHSGDAKEANAAAARDYRERTAGKFVRVERAALERLAAAIETAAEKGDPDALHLRRSSGTSLLNNLALLFERRAS